MADENTKDAGETEAEPLPAAPATEQGQDGNQQPHETSAAAAQEEQPSPQPALLQVDTLHDSDPLTDSAREDDATTTEAEVDTEIEVDPDDMNDVKASTSGSGMESIVSNNKDAEAPEEEETPEEQQPLTETKVMPQSDLEIDLEKGHPSANGGSVTPKDMIVVTTEGQTQKEFMKFLRKREIVFCMIGGIAFLIGLIMIIIGLLIMQGKCDKRYWTPEHTSNHHGSTALVRSGGSHDHHGEAEHDERVVYVHNHHINNDIDVSFEDSKLNLAEGRPAYQSSTEVHEGVAHNASLATDGSTSLTKQTCSQTQLEEKPYWFVDLGKEQRVQRIKLIAQAGQLHDFEVRIGSNMEDLRLNHLCKEFLGTALKVSINLKCDQYFIGRYVSIQMLGDESRPRDTLSLCEVLVYAI